MRERKSNMLGDIVRMEAVNAGQNIGAGYVDQDDFYPADGTENDDLDTIDMVYDNSENDLSPSADFFDGDYQNSYADGEEDNYNDFDDDEDYEDDEDYDDFDDDEDYDYHEEEYDPEEDEYYDEEDDFASLNGYGNPYETEAEWGDFDGEDDLDMEESMGNYDDLGSGGFDFFEGGDPELDADYNCFDADTYSEVRGRRKKRNAGQTAEKALSYTPLGMAKKALDVRFSEKGQERAEKRRDAREKRREDRRADRMTNRENLKSERKERKEERQGIRSQKKLSKIGETEARSEATRALAVPQADVSLTQVTTDLTKKAEAPKKDGLSTGAIVGISVGALAVVGTVLFFVLRKK